MTNVNIEMSQRIKNLSFLAACLVVALHVRNGFADVGYFSLWASRFGHIAVPVFFTISGYLLMGSTDSNNWWRVVMRRKVVTLAIPYLCINIIYFVVSVVYAIAYPSQEVHLSFPMVIAAIGLNPFMPSACGSLWFVRNLFLLFVCSWCLVFIVKLSCTAALMMCLCAFACYLMIHCDGIILDFMLYTFSLRGLTYFVLGLSLRRWKNFNNRAIATLGVVIGLVCIVCVGGGRVSKVGIFLVTYGVMQLWTCHTMPGVLTDNSFPLYVMHPLLIYFFKVLLGGLRLGSLYAFFAWVCVVTVVVFMANSFKKIMPRASNVIFGGR